MEQPSLFIAYAIPARVCVASIAENAASKLANLQRKPAAHRLFLRLGVTSASNYLKFNLIDESGNEAYGSFVSSSPSAAFNISTTALNHANDWKVFFATKKAGAKTEFSYKIESAAQLTNTTATITYANL